MKLPARIIPWVADCPEPQTITAEGNNHGRSVLALAGGAELPCDQHRRHQRPGAASPIFRCRPSSRLDQWVTPCLFGGGRGVAATIRRWSTCRGRPDRGSSASPARTDDDRTQPLRLRAIPRTQPQRSRRTIRHSPSSTQPKRQSTNDARYELIITHYQRPGSAT